MRYLGKKSLSSFLSVLLHVLWYVVLVVSIIVFVMGALFLFVRPIQDSITAGITQGNLANFNMDDWQEFQNIHVALKILMLPYFGAIVFLLLRILGKSRHLFKNFTHDAIFNKNNVAFIFQIGKLLIIFSILTFNLVSLIVGILLLILCEIFKNGTALQEEYDLTV